MFTKRKFLGLPLAQRHKKCAELLRSIFDTKSEVKKQHYHTLRDWLALTPIALDPKELADQFHWHLNQAKRNVKEHNLLTIETQDRDFAEPLWPISICLDNIRSAHNIGSIMRTTEALSLGTLHFSEQMATKEHPQVKKTSMGSADWVQAKTCYDLKTLPKPFIALETSEKAHSLHDFLFPETFTLALGNEEYGLSKATLAHADYVLSIPMRGRKNSLNVANAFAMVAAEIFRQRTT